MMGDKGSAAKRPRLEDSDDSDDEIWAHAVEQDEAIQSQRLTQQSQMTNPVATEGPNSQSTLMSTQNSPMLKPNLPTFKNTPNVFAVPAPARQRPLGEHDLDAKMQNLLNELRKRSSEKLALQKELNIFRTKQANFCANNCKKRLDILNDDLRFKQKEIDAQRRRIKELESRKFDSPKKLIIPVVEAPLRPPDPPKLFAGSSAQKPVRDFPILDDGVPLDLEVFKDFCQADPSDLFARRHFARWCREQVRVCTASEDKVDALKQHLPNVFDRVVASGDAELCTALLCFLCHVQRVANTLLTTHVDWRRMLPHASKHLCFLLALTKFLSKSVDNVALFPVLRAAINDEINWRCRQFYQLLDSVLEMVLVQSWSYESVSMVKQVLRVYREILNKTTEPGMVERMLMRALMFRLDGAPIESELVAVVTRGEAFLHLGDVLKKIIRCQPTLSYTGCPEMMEIADESFRDD